MELPVYVAIAGMTHYYGTSFLKPGQLVHLLKDPDNPYDQEAIKAEMLNWKTNCHYDLTPAEMQGVFIFLSMRETN